ncbi:HAMP domain-containing histidine kinase [Rhodocytophaga rosea]|uniref:histidine kinase n=1 Tax=Rhodocytophaga rosea TaxID=2704465 RepID=A0A6C0GSB3_9BACT|nr:HAMP domain-containing sensor histidine kinase [Rhodocytophaga rosea]QHT70978.1 HAMP domain-containing histidine kinase [Rhodocytophaga rosea]
MKKVFDYFLEHYQNESLSVYKKTRVLIKASITSVLVLLPIILMHCFSHGPALLIGSDILFIGLMLFPLFLIRQKKFEAAANIIMLGVSLSIILQNPFNDLTSNVVHPYNRCLETAILFIASIVLVALFAYKKYQLVMLVSTGIVATVSHYFILIHRHYQSQHSQQSIIFIVTFVFIMFLAGLLSRFMMNMYSDLIWIVEKEAQKVKLYNQNLEQKVAERTRELKIQNEELKKVNSELDRFVYSVSHDLRAPLLSTQGLINILQMETDESKKGQYLALMNKSIQKLDGFIQEIIHLSRNTRLEIQKDYIDFQKLVQNVLQEHAYMDNAGKIEYITQVNQPTAFVSDYKRLEVVLNNVVSNAIRYANMYHSDPFVKIVVDVKPDKALIEVTDNGQGIGREHISKVFDMFYRATANKAGSGLGLYIVKETIQKLNGSIDLTSEPGCGTSFYIQVPSVS